MNNLKILITGLFCSVTLSGCGLTWQVNPTDAKELIEPIAYTNASSTALNIANQTDLTRDYSFGGQKYKSPLKDFTAAEVEAKKAKINKKVNSAAQASYVIGGINILAGKLISIIDVGAGGLIGLSDHSSKHPAYTSRWFVSVNASEFKSENEAKLKIANTIEDAILAEAKIYGVEIQSKQSGKFTMYDYIKDGKKIYLGGMHRTNLESHRVEPVTKQKVNFNGESVDSYNVGLRDAYGYDKLIYPVMLSPFQYKSIVGDDTYDEFMKRVTARLPKTYFYYQKSFPEFYYKGVKYIQTSLVVPAIYNHGQRYDFIKPIK